MQSTTERRQMMLEFLSVKRVTTFTEIMTQFNVSRRTVIRNIEILSCSAPIYTTQGNSGGIKVSDGWYLSKAYLSAKQEVLLNNLLSQLSNDDKNTMQEILNKFAIPKISRE